MSDEEKLNAICAKWHCSMTHAKRILEIERLEDMIKGLPETEVLKPVIQQMFKVIKSA